MNLQIEPLPISVVTNTFRRPAINLSSGHSHTTKFLVTSQSSSPALLSNRESSRDDSGSDRSLRFQPTRNNRSPWSHRLNPIHRLSALLRSGLPRSGIYRFQNKPPAGYDCCKFQPAV